MEKRTTHLIDSPLVVLALELRFPWYKFPSGNAARELCQAVLPHLVLPEGADGLVIAIEPRTQLRWRIRKVPGAEIFRRGAGSAEERIPTTAAGWTRGSRINVSFRGTMLSIAAVLIFFSLAMRLFEEPVLETPEDYRRALPELQRAAREDPRDFDNQFDLGWGLAELERFEEVIPAFRAATQLDPQSAPALNNLGWALHRTRRYQEAIDPLQRATRLDPDYSLAHHNLGWALANMRRWDEALESYHRTIRLDTGNAGAHTELAWVLVELGQSEEALTHAKRVVELKPDDPYHRNGLAWTLTEAGEYEEAIPVVREQIRRDPENGGHWGHLGRLLYWTNQPDEALQACHKAQQLQPDYLDRNERDRGIWESLAGEDQPGPPSSRHTASRSSGIRSGSATP